MTHVSAEERAAAHTLFGGNTDIAVVVSQQGDQTRLVGRVGRSLEQSFLLPEDVLAPLVASFRGDGGGRAHAAASIHDTDDHEAIETEAIVLTEDELGMQFGTFS